MTHQQHITHLSELINSNKIEKYDPKIKEYTVVSKLDWMAAEKKLNTGMKDGRTDGWMDGRHDGDGREKYISIDE
jgi:hypothetical protein